MIGEALVVDKILLVNIRISPLGNVTIDEALIKGHVLAIRIFVHYQIDIDEWLDQRLQRWL